MNTNLGNLTSTFEYEYIALHEAVTSAQRLRAYSFHYSFNMKSFKISNYFIPLFTFVLVRRIILYLESKAIVKSGYMEDSVNI